MNEWRVRPYQTGFTLLEVLVAFAVLMLTLGVMFQIYAKGARSERLATEYSYALVVAHNQLARLDSGARLLAGDAMGQAEVRYQWRTSVREADAGLTDDLRRNYIPYDVRVEVEWLSGNDRRRVHLDTLRLAKK